MAANVTCATDVAPPRHFRIRGSLSYFAPMFASGVILPFFPIWMRDAGLSDGQIALVLAASMVVKILVTPFVGWLSDQIGERADVLVWSGFASLALAVALGFSSGFWAIFLVFCLFNATFAPYVPVVESIIISGVRRFGYSYGGMRVWGSFAFVAATLIAGQVMSAYGTHSVITVMAGGLAMAALAAFLAPRLGKAPERLLAATTDKSPMQFGLQMMLVGACLVQASHGLLYGFSSIYWESAGFSGATIGYLWSASVLAEILVFIGGRRLLGRLGPWTLIRLGCAIAVCRWLLFPLPLSEFGYFLLQCTHAFTYAFVHIGVQQRIMETVSESYEGSAQGNYFFYNNAFLAVSTLASGPLYRQWGLHGFFVMAGVALAGLLIVAASWYFTPKTAVSGGKDR